MLITINQWSVLGWRTWGTSVLLLGPFSRLEHLSVSQRIWPLPCPQRTSLVPGMALACGSGQLARDILQSLWLVWWRGQDPHYRQTAGAVAGSPGKEMLICRGASLALLPHLPLCVADTKEGKEGNWCRSTESGSHRVVPLVKPGLKLDIFQEFSFKWAQIFHFCLNKFGLGFLSSCKPKISH